MDQEFTLPNVLFPRYTSLLDIEYASPESQPQAFPAFHAASGYVIQNVILSNSVVTECDLVAFTHPFNKHAFSILYGKVEMLKILRSPKMVKKEWDMT